MLDLENLKNKINNHLNNITPEEAQKWYDEVVLSYYGGQENIDDDDYMTKSSNDFIYDDIFLSDLKIIKEKITSLYNNLSYIGISPLNKTDCSLIIKLNSLNPHYQDLKTISGMIYDMRSNSEITDSTFDNIMSINLLHPDINPHLNEEFMSLYDL